MARLIACESSGESLVLRIYRSFSFSKESRSNCDHKNILNDNFLITTEFYGRSPPAVESAKVNMSPGNLKSAGKDFTDVTYVN